MDSWFYKRWSLCESLWFRLIDSAFSSVLYFLSVIFKLWSILFFLKLDFSWLFIKQLFNCLSILRNVLIVFVFQYFGGISFVYQQMVKSISLKIHCSYRLSSGEKLRQSQPDSCFIFMTLAQHFKENWFSCHLWIWTPMWHSLCFFSEIETFMQNNSIDRHEKWNKFSIIFRNRATSSTKHALAAAKQSVINA